MNINTNYVSTNMIVMDISKGHNIEITKAMVEKSIHTFKNAPVIYNPNQELSDYRDADRVNDFYKDEVVGIIMDVVIVDNQVIGKILWYDNCHIKEKYDNWYISLSDDKSEFILKGVEIS
ncbi:hypothetical protein [Clostridioides difficile]|uniref:hypothetical protein n=1 Tax=Clostridioides difficile TaxID=1496 RepID=UPI000BB19261|nr:hypothetical protein [Clostridioides difficile]PBD80344.1 hypothetical protein BGU03_04670 [Clostridioides difficile]